MARSLLRDARHHWAAWFKADPDDTTQLYYCVVCGLVTAKVKDDKLPDLIATILRAAFLPALVTQLFTPSPIMQRFTAPKHNA